tara:strand:- start:781 stop:1191 length:411 start_codon:yes stop_codon:yes gene_type:complete
VPAWKRENKTMKKENASKQLINGCLVGHAAIEYAEENDLLLNKFADPTENDAGCWLDGARGQYIGEEVQNIAANCGWKGETLSADQEWYCEAWDEAEQYLNGNVAPKGFFFGTTSWGGDWGLWSVDEDEDEDENED